VSGTHAGTVVLNSCSRHRLSEQELEYLSTAAGRRLHLMFGDLDEIIPPASMQKAAAVISKAHSATMAPHNQFHQDATLEGVKHRFVSVRIKRYALLTNVFSTLDLFSQFRVGLKTKL
jgi:hypothetical protein